MKKGRLPEGRAQRPRSVGHARCEPDHQCDLGCPTSTTVWGSLVGEARQGAFVLLGHSVARPVLGGGDAMQVVYQACAGLDVHKPTVVGCAIVPGANGQQCKERRTFSTMTPDLVRLRQWLTDRGVTPVAMESPAS